ncbi:MAG: ABC transporter permease, partial [Oscillospiraceae bacterium]|nr:ABC transporter permease [Oscillospiraceae bacterium]
MDSLMSYFSSLNPLNLLNSMPGAIAQGIIWGIMALGVYITFRILDVADLSVDGTFATGGAVTVMLRLAGMPIWSCLLIAVLAGVIAGTITGFLHTKLGIPAILAGILTQLGLYSINLRIMDLSAHKNFNFGESGLYVTSGNITQSIIVSGIFAVAIVILLYWYFGTEQGSALRATGSNHSMSSAQGINIGTMKVIGLALSNGIVALSGGLFAQYQGNADVNMG